MTTLEGASPLPDEGRIEVVANAALIEAEVVGSSIVRMARFLGRALLDAPAGPYAAYKPKR